MVALVEHFGRENAGRHSEWLQQRQWFIKARQDSQRKEELADKNQDAIVGLAMEVVAATAAQIAAFEIKLNDYDEATMAALMENNEQLDAVRERIADMQAQAYQLEDGRRVYKTEDGMQVFDETGTEVGPEDVLPEEIRDDLPTWEQFSAERELETTLETQQADLLEYQAKIDDARDQIEQDGLTEAELEELDASLLEAMPPEVSYRLDQTDASVDAEQTTALNAGLPVKTVTQPSWSAPGGP